jgi:hypothetical protein
MRRAARAMMLAGALKVGQARATRRRRKATPATPAIATKAAKPQRRARAR